MPPLASHFPDTVYAAGTGLVDVVRTGGRSVVTRAYATSPLRLLTPRNHGGAAWVYASSYGGGLVDGDAIRLDLQIGQGAHAFVSSQASTKVYRSPGGTGIDVTARLADEAALVLWPDPVVCFAGSSFTQRQEVEMAPGAALVLVDTMTSGRRGSGERWRFARYATKLTVRDRGRLILLDALALAADDGELLERMGRFDVVCTAVIAGERLRAEAERIFAAVADTGIARRPDMLIAASRLADTGCLLRIAARSAEEVTRVLREQLGFVASLLGDDPWARKW